MVSSRAFTRLGQYLFRLSRVRFIRFLFVGGINAVFGYSVYSLLILLQVHYAIATFLSTVLGILFNFKTYGALVFHSHDNALILRFFGCYGITYVINTLAIGILYDLSIPYMVSGAVLLLPVGVISYILQKRFVYGKREMGGR